MKQFFIFAVVLFAACAAKVPPSGTPLVSAEASSVYTTVSVDTLYSTACDGNCAVPLKYAWSKVSGPGMQKITNDTTKQATISGLQTGWYIFKSTVTNSLGISASDTVGFLVNIPTIITVTTPPVPVDSLGIINAYMVLHPVPADRIATGFSIGINGQLTVSYNRGATSIYSILKPINIQ